MTDRPGLAAKSRQTTPGDAPTPSGKMRLHHYASKGLGRGRVAMQRYYDHEAIRDDVSAALEEVFKRHGLPSFWHPLAVSATIEVLASPLKYQLQATPLTVEVGRIGGQLYAASRLVLAVELAKSPHSQTINPMMDAIARALAKQRGPLSDELMLRNALRIHLGRPRLSLAVATNGDGPIGWLHASYKRARGYLETAKIIEQNEDERWQLCETYLWALG